MKSLIILGTGGNCFDILDTVNEINRHSGQDELKCVGFLDDNEENWGEIFHGIKVLGPLCSAAEYFDCSFVNGIGSVSNFWKKKDIIATTGIPIEKFLTIIHPSANVSNLAKLGHGVVVLQNVTIASNVVVGSHVIILPNTVISHDGIVGDYCCIAGGVCISGSTSIGHSCYVGGNSAIIGNVGIGEHSLIGLGAVVLDDIVQNSVVVGNPARFLRKTIELI